MTASKGIKCIKPLLRFSCAIFDTLNAFRYKILSLFETLNINGINLIC